MFNECCMGLNNLDENKYKHQQLIEKNNKDILIRKYRK